MCRSALKLVEMNALAGVMGKDGRALFTWLDVCGGPGGFRYYVKHLGISSYDILMTCSCMSPGRRSEYIQWRCAEDGRACRGWGITLRDTASDWQLDDSETFTITYGKDDTGDIYKV